MISKKESVMFFSQYLLNLVLHYSIANHLSTELPTFYIYFHASELKD